MQRDNNYMTRNFVLISTIFMFVSCDNSIVFEKYKSFQNQEWNADSLVKFEYFINDTISKHKCSLKIRNSVDYKFQNLFLFIYSDLSKDTVELLLADKKGKWIGNGVGDIREVEIILENEKVYTNKGKHTFMIEQAMRYGSNNNISNLKHIEAVGVTIIKENE
ncbi:gliding motility lipoprotein GldH [Flavobacteriales bacterium]|nr:gliding motility lipoprotein GldH [Flavobacteriales bacterium]